MQARHRYNPQGKLGGKSIKTSYQHPDSAQLEASHLFYSCRNLVKAARKTLPRRRCQLQTANPSKKNHPLETQTRAILGNNTTCKIIHKGKQADNNNNNQTPKTRRFHISSSSRESSQVPHENKRDARCMTLPSSPPYFFYPTALKPQQDV